MVRGNLYDWRISFSEKFLCHYLLLLLLLGGSPRWLAAAEVAARPHKKGWLAGAGGGVTSAWCLLPFLALLLGVLYVVVELDSPNLCMGFLPLPPFVAANFQQR